MSAIMDSQTKYDLYEVLQTFVVQWNRQDLRTNYSNIYIPYNFFQDIGKNYGWFRYSRLMGIKDNKIYTMYLNSGNNICIMIINYEDYTYYSFEAPFNTFYYWIFGFEIPYNTSGNPPVSTFNMNRLAWNYYDIPELFDANYTLKNDITFHVGQSYLDDFLYSTKSTDIFVMSLYFFIPLLLFIFAIKVLRKGLFK